MCWPTLPAMRRIYTLIPLFLLICSCNGVNKEKSEQPETGKKTKSLIIKKPGSSFNDTLIIKNKSAVFYIADTLQMEKIKKINEKEIFDLLTHNCHYQMQNARQVIKKDWPQIKIIETSKYRFLLFQKANKDKKFIDLNDKNDICGLFLFDTKKDPVLVDMPNIDTQLRLYFPK
jgi:hypothetical protein